MTDKSITKTKYIKLILILGSLTALGPFSIDMYLPGFAGIAKDLNTSVANVSMTLSSYFIGISAGQLLYGPLLDRFGRKKPPKNPKTYFIFEIMSISFLILKLFKTNKIINKPNAFFKIKGCP